MSQLKLQAEPCLDTLTFSAVSADLPKQQSLLEESSPSNLLKTTPTHRPHCDRTSQVSPSTQTSATTTPSQENFNSSRLDFLVPGQVTPDCGLDLTTQSQPYGLKHCGALQMGSQALSSSKILLGLSAEDFEQFLEDSEWSAIVGTIHKSYQQRNWERRKKGKGFSLLPTPTTYAKGSGKCRPAGQTKLEVRLRQFISPGDKLHPAVPGWMMGFPAGWVEEVLMDGGQKIQLPSIAEYVAIPPSGESVTISTLDQSCQKLQRSPSDESSTSTALSEIFKADSCSDMKSHTSTPPAPMSSQEPAAAKSFSLKESNPPIPYDSSNEVAPVEVLEELTYDEERDRHRLELRVERAFYEAGAALRELRDRRLYRSMHKTFEDYVRERFGYSRITAHYKIAAAAVVDNLLTNGEQILPTNERQVRDMMRHSPQLQCSIWSQSVEKAGGKVPSSRIVKGIVEQLRAKPLSLAKDFCQVGDVFTLVRLEGKERKYNGCWAIAVELKDFTVLVDVHDATLSVKPDNLDKIDSPDVKRQLPQILKRIRRVRQLPGFRDRVAYTVLEHLGRQTYLTPLEDKVLRLIEQEYGVEDYDC
jgi:hypothetical protein